MATMLPPLAWLRGREWGRDVTAFARNDVERIRDIEILAGFVEDDMISLDRVVNIGLYRSTGGARGRGFGEEQAVAVAGLSRHEQAIAGQMVPFLISGARYVSMGPDLVATAMASRDSGAFEVSGPNACFYVTCEGMDLEGPDGSLLDGFMVDRFADGVGGLNLNITPMSRTLPPLDAGALTPYPAVELEMDPGEGVAERLEAWISEVLEAQVDAVREERASEDDEGKTFDDIVRRAYLKVRGIQEGIVRKQIEWYRAHGGYCLALVSQALACVDGTGPVGLQVYPEGAEAHLVAKAFSCRPGARKADQKLAAMGFPRTTRYEIGNEMPEQAACASMPNDGQMDDHKVDGAIGDKSGAVEAAIEERMHRRKDKRRRRLAERGEIKPVIHVPKVVEEAPRYSPRDTEKACIPKTVQAEDLGDRSQVVPLGMDEDLASRTAEVLHRTMKDLPAIGSRNWEASFPSALAAILMRKVRVARNPRESADAARRRIAADILPRLEGFPEHLALLSAEEAANPAFRRFARVERPVAARKVDGYVADEAVHPVLVHVVGDDALADRLRFPGTAGSGTDGTVVVRAWMSGGTLRLDGILHEGCLAGFRRIEYDLAEERITTFDGDADRTDPEDLLDALYAPVADAVLGPVDEADAWMHGRRERAAKTEARSISDARAHASEEIRETVFRSAPEQEEFADWTSVSAPWANPPLGGEDLTRVRDVFSANSVASAVHDAIARRETEDRAVLDAMNAAGRYASSFAASTDARIAAVIRPDIDDVDLAGIKDADGLLVVTDPAFVEQLGPGVLPGRRASRERPVAVMYRLRREGLTALLLQVAADSGIVYANWVSTASGADAGADDATWYVRGLVHDAVSPKAPVVAQASERLSAAPVVTRRQRVSRQGPRRVVAQTRLRPRHLATAIAVIRRWFDDQAAKHGENLIEDRREDGEWVLEHVSVAREQTSRWSVTVRMPSDHPGAIDILVKTTLATGVRPRLPTLVREIAEATPTEGPDGILHVEAPAVRSRGEALDLIRHLQSPERTLPTLVMTPDRDGAYLKPPSDVVRQSLGAMNVRVVTTEMTYELTDAFGQEYRTFNGAARLFQPRFDPDVDPASRHPRIMPDVAGERALGELISRVTAATLTRYDIPETAVQPVRPEVDREPAPVVEDAADDAQTSLPFEGGEREALERVQDEPELGLPEQDRQTSEPADEEETAVANEIPDDPKAQERPEAEKREISPPERKRKEKVQAPAEDRKADAAKAGQTRQPAAAPAGMAEDVAALVERSISRHIEAIGISGLVGRVAELVANVERMSADLAARSAAIGDTEAVIERDARIAALTEELRTERETMQDLLNESEAERANAVAESARFRQALNERRRISQAGDRPAWPKDISGLSEWLDENVLPNVVITTKAWRAMRHVQYTDMERLCRTLQLLDGVYVDMRAGEDGARQRWEDGLRELRLENKKQTEMGKSIRKGAEYRFVHEGATWDMDFHLRGTESLHNQHDRLLRIYFAFDREQGRVLIGHMPTHLTTIDS